MLYYYLYTSSLLQAADSCPAFPITNYSLELTNTITDVSTQLEISFSSKTTISVTVNSSRVTGRLLENAVYNYTIQAHNEVGAVQYTTGEICEYH